jgi:hypothetical protein
VFANPTKPTLGSKAVGKAPAVVAAATVLADDEVAAAGVALACAVSPAGLVTEVGDVNCGSVEACEEAA